MQPQFNGLEGANTESAGCESVQSRCERWNSLQPQSIRLDSLEPQNNSLDGLEPQSNGLDNLEPQNNELDSLELQNNGLDSLEPQNNELDSLKLQNNSLDSLEPQNNGLDNLVPRNNSLDSLELQNNSLDSLELQNNGLDILEAHSNGLEDSEPESSELEIIDQYSTVIGLVSEQPDGTNILEEYQPESNSPSMQPQARIGKLEKVLPQSNGLDDVQPFCDALASMKPRSDGWLEGWIKTIRGILLFLLINICGYCIILSWMFPLLPILLVSPLFCRKAWDFANGVMFAGLPESIIGMKIVLTGDEIRSDEANLSVMNHPTQLDWMWVWAVYMRHSGTFTEKPVAKEPVKWMPPIGWAMQFGAHLLLQRRMERDQKHISDLVDLYASYNYKPQFQLFPEGTNMHPNTKRSSDKFAMKSGLPKYNYVLHPRTTGFVYCVQKLRQRDMLTAVYDITVAYPQGCSNSPWSLLCGTYPTEAHFNIKRYADKDLPRSDEDLKLWCLERYEEKERALKQFYEVDRKFPEQDTPEEKERAAKIELRNRCKVYCYVICVYIYTSVCIWLLCTCSWARWFALFASVILTVATCLGGLDNLQISLTDWSKLKEKNRDKKLD